MSKKITSIACSDWHRGWGIGYNTIGRLHKTETPNVFTWKGRNQGRHGQKWNRGTVLTFKHNDGSEPDQMFTIIERKGSGSLPYWEDVIKAINTLKQQ